MFKRITVLFTAAVLMCALSLPAASAVFTNPDDPDYDPNAPENDPNAKVTYGTGFTPTSSFDFSVFPPYDPEEGEAIYSVDVTPTARLNMGNQPQSVPGQVVLLKTPTVHHDLGPNYYVQAEATYQYTAAFARVLLPQVSNTEGRRPFIALGVAGMKGARDLGVTYENGRWIPYSYDTGNGPDGLSKFVPYSHFQGDTQGAAYAVINVAVEGRTLFWSIKFQDADGQTLSTFWRELNINANNIPTQYANPTVSFYRFASLSPVPDAADGSTGASMVGGAFLGCQLYDGVRNTYVPWGMADATAASVWTVHPTCIDLSYDGTTDAFSIHD